MRNQPFFDILLLTNNEMLECPTCEKTTYSLLIVCNGSLLDEELDELNNYLLTEFNITCTNIAFQNWTTLQLKINDKHQGKLIASAIKLKFG